MLVLALIPFPLSTLPLHKSLRARCYEPCCGKITKWKSSEKKELMILWQGKERNETAVLANLDKDAGGVSLNLKLHDYADGSPAPTLQVVPPPPPQPQADNEPEEEEEEDTDDGHHCGSRCGAARASMFARCDVWRGGDGRRRERIRY